MAKIKVDFTNTEDSGNGGQVSPGKYSVVVESTSVEEGKSAPYIQWKLRILTAPCAGLHINHITSLAPQALFNLRNTLIAMGMTVPKSAVMIDPDKFVGKTFGIEVVMTTKDGKEYPNVKSVYALGQAVASTPVTSTPPSIQVDDEVTISLD